MLGMEKKKKLIILIIFIAIATSIAIYFIVQNRVKDSTSNLIKQDSLSTSNQEIDLDNTTVPSISSYAYPISSNTSLSKVQEFVQILDPEMKIDTQKEGSYYRWKKNNDYVIYELDQNYLLFNTESGLQWNEASLNGYSFSQFLSKYFGKSWTYTMFESKKMTTGETIYYAKRYINNIEVETILDKQETDYLAMKDGKIMYGKILLVEVDSSQKEVPLISEYKLKENINLSMYPKEVYPQFGALQSIVLADVDYKSEEFASIASTLSDCISSSAELVYLYKSMDQVYMTPVYKLDLTCSITYEGYSYSVPAIGYVNAIDPEHISAE
jgi:hypothetical protein